MSAEIEHALDLWEKFDDDTRGRRGKSGASVTGRAGRRSPSESAALRASLSRTVARVPEVMVRVTGHARDMASITRAVAYQGQAKERDEVVEDDRGVLYQGPGSEREAVAGWERGVLGPPIPRVASPVPIKGDRQAVNLMLSMPAGTPLDEVRDAARAFGQEEFGGRHPFVFTAHRDTDHAHVHMTVRLTGHDGHRLRIRKPDLARYRATFARELRERGIAANATSKSARRTAAPTVPQAVYQSRKRAGQSPRPAPSAQRKVPVGGLGRAAREAYAAAASAFGRSADPRDQALAQAISAYASESAAPNRTPERPDQSIDTGPSV